MSSSISTAISTVTDVATAVSTAISISTVMSSAPATLSTATASWTSHPSLNGTWPTTIYEVVTAYETFCPGPTSFMRNDNTYIVVEPTTITFTDCPCTLTHAAEQVKPGPTGAPAPAPAPVPVPGTPGTPSPPGTQPAEPVATAGAPVGFKASLPVLAGLLLAFVGVFVGM